MIKWKHSSRLENVSRSKHSSRLEYTQIFSRWKHIQCIFPKVKLITDHVVNYAWTLQANHDTEHIPDFLVFHLHTFPKEKTQLLSLSQTSCFSMTKASWLWRKNQQKFNLPAEIGDFSWDAQIFPWYNHRNCRKLRATGPSFDIVPVPQFM